jgi:hypothetical protein
MAMMSGGRVRLALLECSGREREMNGVETKVGEWENCKNRAAGCREDRTLDHPFTGQKQKPECGRDY